MKTIFRLTNLGLLLVALLAFGAVTGLAQDPCTDADGQTKMSDDFDAKYANKTDLSVRQQAIDAGKAFLDKYGNCDATKEKSDWLKKNIPVMEKKLADQKAGAKKDAMIKRFNTALTGKNWDEVYASAKDLMATYPGEFTGLELVLGSIGYDELLDNKNAKYSDQTMSYAKQSLADLEAGKTFTPGFGVPPFVYKTKDDATAWMNLTIGSIYYVGQKNKQAALPYLYKATQAPKESDVAKNPNPYEFIGSYYFDELNKIVEEIQAKAKDQAATAATDTPEVSQKKLDDIKALVAMSNGTAERAMDAFARAYTLGVKPEYKKKMKDNVAAAYKLRFAKEDGVDAWIASAVAKPFVNPTTPVQPISDPEPVKTGGAGDAAAGSTATGGPNAKPAGTTTNTTVKPAGNTTTTTAKPVATPIKPVTKPGAAAVKTVAKKNVG